MAESEIGLVGLAVMGENLAMNMRNHGFSVSVYNRTGERTRLLVEGRGKGLSPTYGVAEFVASLAKPRRPRPRADADVGGHRLWHCTDFRHDLGAGS